MWPSEDLASRLYNVANVVLIGSLVFGAASTVLVVWMGNVKEAYLRTELSEASGRAVKAEGDAGTANQKAGEANERAACLEVEAASQRKRAAQLELESLQLRKQLLVQGPRENLLIGEKRPRLVTLLKRSSGQKVDVRYSASAIEVNGKVVMSTPIGDDGTGLARSLISVLNEAGWNTPANPLLSTYQGRGLMVEVLTSASPETKTAAKELVEALRETTLMIDGPFSVDNERAKRVGTEVISPAFDENTIVLTVLTHP